MIFVVDHGSGYRAQIAGMQVAGKTGTAASGASVPHAWFIAFAPARHPVIAVAVLHEFSGEGFKYAAPIARRVLIAGLHAQGYTKVR
jgi:peptidoglycan glycosyltransferase